MDECVVTGSTPCPDRYRLPEEFLLSVQQVSAELRVTCSLRRDLGDGALNVAEVFDSEIDGRCTDVFLQPVQLLKSILPSAVDPTQPRASGG